MARSIRVSLLSNLMVLILVLGLSIMAATFLGSRGKLEALSRSLTSQALDRTESELFHFFEPVSRGLDMVRLWGQTGHLEVENSEALNRLFIPLLQQYLQITAIMIADSRGREYLLLRREGYWVNRETRQDEWGDRCRWLEWRPGQAAPVISWEDLGYDPRTRPWFQAAMHQGEAPPAAPSREKLDGRIHWTEPYSFFTTEDPGITASSRVRAPNGQEWVIGFDVLLSDISGFTTNMRLGGQGRVFVLTEDHRFIGLPSTPGLEDPDRRKAALLKRPQELGLTTAVDMIAALQQPDGPGETAKRFYSEGLAWWGQARRFSLTPERAFHLAVAIPETQLLGGLNRVRVLIILVTLGVLSLAIWRAFAMAGRFSRPLEALARQSDRISHGNFERGETFSCSVREVRQLAEAHERMREGLQSLVKLENDLKLAKRIQQNTFPEELPHLPGYELAAWGEPAEETGGDTYDVIGIHHPNKEAAQRGEAARAVLLLADATGHGIGPALSVTQVRSMLQMAIRMQAPLASIARHMNDQLCMDLPNDRFITAWLGDLDTRNHLLQGYSAGQGPILLFRKDAAEAVQVEVDAPPFGIVSDLEIVLAEPISLRPGDVFAVLSDGFFEAENPVGEFFGEERVVSLIQRHRGESTRSILDALRAEVHAFARGRQADDDRTAILIKRLESSGL